MIGNCKLLSGERFSHRVIYSQIPRDYLYQNDITEGPPELLLEFYIMLPWLPFVVTVYRCSLWNQYGILGNGHAVVFMNFHNFRAHYIIMKDVLFLELISVGTNLDYTCEYVVKNLQTNISTCIHYSANKNTFHLKSNTVVMESQ